MISVTLVTCIPISRSGTSCACPGKNLAMCSQVCHAILEEADEALHLAQSCSEGGSLRTCGPKDLLEWSHPQKGVFASSALSTCSLGRQRLCIQPSSYLQRTLGDLSPHSDRTSTG